MPWTDANEQELQQAQKELLQAQYGDVPPVDPKGYVDLFHPFFRRVEQARGLPPGIISGMAEKESSGNTVIKSKTKGSSAAGLFQINDATARDWGVRDRRDPVEVTIKAADILARRAAKYGLERAVAMHYSGEHGPFSPSYAAKVFELAQRYANP